jgi:hypothetical protein
MQFLMMIKAAENQGMPPQSLFDAMGEYVQKSFANGVLVNTAGLMPTSHAVEVQIRNGKMKVVDGPFTEAKEVIGGYAIVNVASRDEAVAIGREFMQLHLDHWPEWQGTSEIREIEEMPQPE